MHFIPDSIQVYTAF